LEEAKPRYGEEISERYLVQETGQLHGVHFSKGCYLGQEIVERVRSRAQIHRHLAAVRIEGTEPPSAGTKLQHEGKDIGEIVSAVYSPSFGEVAAMAYVRTEAEEQRPAMTVVGSGAKALLTPARADHQQ
jgi:folate-binding protein YgfZ